MAFLEDLEYTVARGRFTAMRNAQRQREGETDEYISISGCEY